MKTTTNSPHQDKKFRFDIERYNNRYTKFFWLFSNLLALNKVENANIKIAGVIDQLDHYSRKHFKIEENHISNIHFDILEYQTLQHHIFTLKVDNFMTAQTYKKSEHLEQMILHMQKWFYMHISQFENKNIVTILVSLEKKRKNRLKIDNQFRINVALNN